MKERVKSYCCLKYKLWKISSSHRDPEGMHSMFTVTYILEEAETENIFFNSMASLMLFTGLFMCLSHFIFCMRKGNQNIRQELHFPQKSHLQFFTNHKDSDQRTEQNEMLQCYSFIKVQLISTHYWKVTFFKMTILGWLKKEKGE